MYYMCTTTLLLVCLLTLTIHCPVLLRSDYHNIYSPIPMLICCEWLNFHTYGLTLSCETARTNFKLEWVLKHNTVHLDLMHCYSTTITYLNIWTHNIFLVLCPEDKMIKCVHSPLCIIGCYWLKHNTQHTVWRLFKIPLHNNLL